MTTALHRDFVTAALDNALTRPQGTTLLGTEINLNNPPLLLCNGIGVSLGGTRPVCRRVGPALAGDPL